jgi:tetratricopeptide (TPR) repeat protein
MLSLRAGLRTLGPVLLLWAALPTPHARAEDPAKTTEDAAAAHYKQGERFFADGNFPAARIEFEAAYALSKAASLLFNVALSFEREGLVKESLEAYRRYLAAEPGDKETREKVAKLERQLAPAAQTSALPTEALPRRSKGPFIAASVGLGTGLAVTLTGCGLLGATASLARSIEQESRTSTELQATLARRERLESASIALVVIGPVVAVGGAVAVWKLQRR